MDENRLTSRQRVEAQLIERAMKDDPFREELVRDPKAAFARELGISVPEHLKVEVVEESPTRVYLVVPQPPPRVGAELSDADLEAIAGGGWSETTECYCEQTDNCVR